MRRLISLFVAAIFCLSSSFPATVMAAGVPVAAQGVAEGALRAACATEIAALLRVQESRDAASEVEKMISTVVPQVNAGTTAQLGKAASIPVVDEGDAFIRCFAETILKRRAAAAISAGKTPAPKPTSPAAAVGNLETVTQCVKPLQPGPAGDGGLYGSMQNTCSFDVSVVYCIRNPAADNSNTQFFNCDRNKMGLDTIPAGARRATHVGNAGDFLWIACRQPAVPQTTYNTSQGMRGHCK